MKGCFFFGSNSFNTQLRYIHLYVTIVYMSIDLSFLS